MLAICKPLTGDMLADGDTTSICSIGPTNAIVTTERVLYCGISCSITRFNYSIKSKSK